MNAFQIVLLVVAILTTVLTAIQMIMQIIGLGIHDEFDAGGGSLEGVDSLNDYGMTAFAQLKFLSVRGIMAFLCLGSWTTLAMLAIPLHWVIAILIGVVVGAIANIAIAFFNRAIMRMRQSGNLDTANSVGKIAEVYLTIPANRAGAGKVNVLVQERFAEIAAVTDLDEAIPTGARVKITGVDNVGTVVVEKL